MDVEERGEACVEGLEGRGVERKTCWQERAGGGTSRYHGQRRSHHFGTIGVYWAVWSLSSLVFAPAICRRRWGMCGGEGTMGRGEGVKTVR